MPPGGLHPRMVAWEVPGGSSSPSVLPQSFIFPQRLPSTPGVPWFHSEELTWNSPPPSASIQRAFLWSLSPEKSLLVHMSRVMCTLQCWGDKVPEPPLTCSLSGLLVPKV